MNNLLGNLRADLRRAFLSPVFPLVAVGMCMALLLSASTEGAEVTSGADIVYIFGVAHVQGFYMLVLVFGALPYATSFCADWNHRFIRESVIRTNISSYAISKTLSCALSGGMAVVLGELLFLLLLRLRLPVLAFHSYSIESFGSGTIGSLLAGGHIAAYFIVRILIEFNAAAVLAVLALWISTYITNPFVTLASPLIAYYFISFTSAAARLPNWLDPYAMLWGLCLANPIASLLYSISCCAFLCVLMGAMIVRQIERRLQNA